MQITKTDVFYIVSDIFKHLNLFENEIKVIHKATVWWEFVHKFVQSKCMFWLDWSPSKYLHPTIVQWFWAPIFLYFLVSSNWLQYNPENVARQVNLSTAWQPRAKDLLNVKRFWQIKGQDFLNLLLIGQHFCELKIFSDLVDIIIKC